MRPSSSSSSSYLETAQVLEQVISAMDQAIAAEAELRNVNEEMLLEKCMKREREENRILRRKVQSEYFRFAPDKYVDKFGYRPVDPNEVGNAAVRASNKAFNRKLKERIFLYTGRLPQDFGRRITIKQAIDSSSNGSGMEVLAWYVLDGLYCDANYNAHDPLDSMFALRECQQRPNGFTVGDFLDNGAVIELHDDDNDDAPCPASNVFRTSDCTDEQRQSYYLYVQRMGDTRQILLIISNDIRDTEFPTEPHTKLQLDVVLGFKVPGYHWTPDHEAWKERVLKCQYSRESTRISKQDEIEYIRKNFSDTLVDNIGSRFGYFHSPPWSSILS